ncbi:hypothetical protein [Ruegeria arenilitoris]|uniref:hypothetical protein n=1 Tax=Ruegeria arenilitoris TaxID=1173585 RepID=UPI00147B7681|nr:hypothetical protein [Ruegeria arenilitoris]
MIEFINDTINSIEGKPHVFTIELTSGTKLIVLMGTQNDRNLLSGQIVPEKLTEYPNPNHWRQTIINPQHITYIEQQGPIPEGWEQGGRL